MSFAWRIAARNLSRNRRRNAAAISAIALGYAGLVLLTGYAVRADDLLRTNSIFLGRTGHLAVYRPGALQGALAQPSKFAMGTDDQRVVSEVLADTPGVMAVGRYLLGMGLVGNGCKAVPFVATGVEPHVEEELATHPELLAHAAEFTTPVSGRPLSAYASIEGATALSRGLARLLGKKVKDDISGGAPRMPDCQAADVKAQIAADANVQLAGLTWSGSLSAVDAEVVSTFRTPLMETEYTTLVTGLSTLQRLYETDAVSYVAAYLDDYRDAPATAREVSRRLAERGAQLEVYTYDHETLGEYYVSTMRFIDAVVSFITTLVVFVIAFSMFNATTLSVLERTREIGTLRALGFRRGDVSALIAGETALLASFACALGLCIGLAGAYAVNLARIMFRPPGVPSDIQLILTPTPLICLALAVIMIAAAVATATLATRARTRETIVGLLSTVRT